MLNRPARLIITADDYGRDEATTIAIADSLTNGLITSTSIMANGSHFELACDLAQRRQLVGRIGVHLSLDEGPALSREMQRYADAGGSLCVRRSLKPLGRQLAHAVEAELSAQIDRVIAAGIRPMHLDSHRHIHTAFPIGRLVVRLARQYRIPYVRCARTVAGRRRRVVGAYQWMFNRYVASRVRTADHFGDIVDFYERRSQATMPGLSECMTHLDDSPRGLTNRRLLTSQEFLAYVGNYQLVSPAETDN
jgi:predicted glycoside hydrolase/deacetylase ChbG (UPF0249 family)